MFHETPLTLLVFSVLGCEPDILSWLFIIGDLMTGLILFKLGEVVSRQTLLTEDAAVSAGLYHSEAKSLLSSLTTSLTLPRLLSLVLLA